MSGRILAVQKSMRGFTGGVTARTFFPVIIVGIFIGQRMGRGCGFIVAPGTEDPMSIGVIVFFEDMAFRLAVRTYGTSPPMNF